MPNVSFKLFSTSAVTLVAALGLVACASSTPATTGPGFSGGGSGNAAISYGGDGPGGGNNCSSSGEFTCGGTSGNGGEGSPDPTGGSASNGGGSTEDNGLGAGVTIKLCEGASIPHIPPASFASCPSIAGCNVSRCVPINALPKGVPPALLGKCGDGNSVCVPDEFIKTYGSFLAKSCTSLGGVEGRCMSTCIPQINGLTDALPIDVCGAAERCAPCYNPNDGTDTQACRQGCDPGPSAETTADKDKHVFEDCATDGKCVPKEIVPKPLDSRLVQTTCTDPDSVCAPVKKSQNLKYNFVSCIPGNFAAVTGAPNTDGSCNITQWGGCIPKWILDLSNPAEEVFMAQMACPADYLCAPCHDPLLPAPGTQAGQVSTGACPIPLPSDPSGGLPPEGSGGVAGIDGTQGKAIGCTPPGGAVDGGVSTGGLTGAGGSGGLTGAGGSSGAAGAP